MQLPNLSCYVIAFVITGFSVTGFTPLPISHSSFSSATRSSSAVVEGGKQLWAAPANQVWILSSEDDVTQAVHKIVNEAATLAIAERGSFALAIPGGSVLKVLSTMEGGDWVSETTLAYVNHKCVPNDDLSSSIHAKVRTGVLWRY